MPANTFGSSPPPPASLPVPRYVRAHPPERPLPARATEARPGTEEKVLVMLARRRRGEALFHPGDEATFARRPTSVPGRGLPPGVTRRRRRFAARAYIPGRGQVCCGSYLTVEEAERAVR